MTRKFTLKNPHQKIITAVLIMALTISCSFSVNTQISASPLANIYVYANPNPVGLNQTMTIVGWITPLPSYTLPNVITWTNITIAVTTPNGNVETFKPTSDPSAAFWINYVPKTLGNYTIKASWTGDASAPSQAFIYAPVETTAQFTVQTDPILPWSSQPLPTEYWQRPINAENSGWGILAGSWLYTQGSARGGYDTGARTDFQPYSLAPNSSHINWVLHATQGGIIGGEGAKSDSGETFLRDAKFVQPVDMIVIGGLGYYVDGWNPEPSSGGASALIGSPADLPGSKDLTAFTIHCVDIITGKELWQKQTYSYGLSPSGGTGRTMLMGQIEPIPVAGSSGSSGPKAFLVSIGTTFVRWDAFTGQMLVMMNNSLTGTFDGQYVYSRSGSYLIKWDTMKIGARLNNTIQSAIVYNVTAPSVTYGTTKSYLSPSTISGNVGVATYSVTYADGVAPGLAGIDLTTGQLLWNTTLYGYEGGEGTGSMAFGKYFYMAGDGAWHAFDVNTGRELWKSEPGQQPWNKFWGYAVAVGYNKLYAECYDGYIYAFDADTGKTVWKFFSGNAGFETPYGTWPWFSPPVVADGKVYASLSEHSPTNPNWHGGKLFCFDAETGDVQWTVPWLGGGKAIADGKLIAQNEYDGQLYCFDKGQTAITVSAPTLAVPDKSPVLIQGTITDQSPGQTCLGIPTAGTPAISDESMDEWMAYLYMQRPKPTNATGVEVNLYVLDANNNYRPIGVTRSDAAGAFSYLWQPDISGKYTVTAKFEGSNSYYSSSAETAFAIEEPKATTTAPTALPQTASDMYFVPATVGLFIAIIIVGAMLALLLLKKHS